MMKRQSCHKGWDKGRGIAGFLTDASGLQNAAAAMPRPEQIEDKALILNR
jgi:hypothetical protein